LGAKVRDVDDSSQGGAGYDEGAYALAVQADGKLVAAGEANTGFYQHSALARYRP